MGCTCAIEVDHEGGAAFYAETTHKARKPHKCSECGNVIRPGEDYERTFGIWDRPETIKTCLPCAEVRGAFFCSFTYGSIWEDFEEDVRANYGQYSDACLRCLSPAAREKVFAAIEAVWADLAEMDDDDE